jgi:putative lipoic acid-binding regulatory protein
MEYDRLKELLDLNHSWPSEYTFKFILPTAKLSEFQKVIPDPKVIMKPSASGKYTSLTLETRCSDSNAVISVYKKVSHIEEIIIL